MRSVNKAWMLVLQGKKQEQADTKRYKGELKLLHLKSFKTL